MPPPILFTVLFEIVPPVIVIVPDSIETPPPEPQSAFPFPSIFAEPLIDNVPSPI